MEVKFKLTFVCIAFILFFVIGCCSEPLYKTGWRGKEMIWLKANRTDKKNGLLLYRREFLNGKYVYYKNRKEEEIVTKKSVGGQGIDRGEMLLNNLEWTGTVPARMRTDGKPENVTNYDRQYKQTLPLSEKEKTRKELKAELDAIRMRKQ